jgi:hypothetical protein
MRIVVYTAWFGTADALKPPRIVNPWVRYICMTDRKDHPSGWEIHQIKATDRPRWLARWAKTHRSWLPPCDVTIWMDASFELLVDPVPLVREAMATNAPIVGFLHPDRKRISEEAEAIIRFGLAPADAVRHQVATYQAAGFDKATPQWRLTTTGLLVRWCSPDVDRFNRDWWHEIQTHTVRDQLSIDYCAWRRRLPIGYLPGHYRDNPFVRYDHAAHRRGRVA